MKQITIENQTFDYKILSERIGHAKYIRTEFYYPGQTESYTYYKYCFWGKCTEILPKLAFTLQNYNIEDPIYSKEKVKKKIMEELSLIIRQKEIDKGDIV